MKKGSKLYGILHLKCPQCQNEKLFVHPFSYRFGRMTEMHSTCQSCGLKYEKEPGFFYGAMYVSYALTVALWVALAVVFYGFFSPSPWVFLAVGIASLFLLLPIIYRLSRAIWLAIFVRYEE